MAETIGTEYIQIEPSFQGVNSQIAKEMDAAGKSGGGSFGAGFASVVGTAGKVAAAAVGAATTAVAGFAASSVSVGANFDKSMAQVAATMGVTVDEIGNLRDFAQEMGSTTAFSATEAADALNYMALASYDADTSMQMLPNVLNLAAAGGIDLASASDMVTDAQTALGLSIEETSTMVDQMAKASSKSNTSVAQLGDAFLTIGANARNVSGGTQELSTVLGVLADNGIKGSEAGTHLRNIMLSLTPTTDKAAAAWDELGVQAYDAEGNLRDLPTIFQELNDSMDGWGDEERTNQLAAMFNKTDLASIQSLLGTTGERWRELSAAIGEADGAASQMAETQLDNLAGDVTLFKSALEGAQIIVSDGLTPTLREFVSFGSEGLSTITAAFKEGGLSGAMEAFGTVLSDGLNMVVEMIPQAVEMGAKLLGALGEGIMNNVDVLASTAMNVATMLLQYLFEALPEVANFAIELVSSLATNLASALPTLIPVVVQGIMGLIAAFTDPANVTMLVQGAIALVQGLADGLLAALPILIRQLPVIIENIVQSLVSSIPLLIQGAIQLVNGIVAALPEIIMALVEALPQIIEALVNGLIEALPLLIEGSIQLTMLLVTHLPEIIVALIQAIPQIVQSIVTALINAAPKLLEAAKTMIETLKTGWQNFFPALITAAVNLFNNLKTQLLNIGRKFMEIGKQIVEGIKTGIAKAWDAFKNWVTGLLSGLVDGIKEFFHIGSPSKLMADEIGRWIPAGIAEGIEKGMGLVDDAMNGMSNNILMSARVTAGDVPQFAASEMVGGSNDSLYQLLATYLPQIAAGGKVNITLDGDAGRLFRLMQRESVRNTQMVGVNSVLSAI